MFHILTDPQLSSMRIVVNPEKIVIKEAQRTYTYMNLYGYSTDLIVCNRLIPESVSDPFLSSVRARQQRYYKLIEEGFSPVPILDVPLFQQEMVGVETLSYMAAVVFGQEDPVKVFYTGPRSKISKVNGHWVMMVPLPFTTKGDVSVLRASGNEVVVQVGHHRRTIMLPTHLAGLEILEAKLDDSLLALRFAARERAGAHR
jgi:arsenite-transporting ATPase